MSTQQDRIANGLCPQCGKEAAPYRICADCRFRARINAALRRGRRLGALSSTGTGRDALWFIGPNPDAWKTRCYNPDTDKRFRPRLGRIPVDVERELLGLISAHGRPLTLEEIMAAWGRLRERRRTHSLIGDMKRLIDAEHRRSARNAKRLKIMSEAAA